MNDERKPFVPFEDRRNAAFEVDDDLVDNISALIDSGNKALVLNIVAGIHPADQAELIEHLDRDEAIKLFDWLPQEEVIEILPELEDSWRTLLLSGMKAHEIADLVDELDTDDAADVIADLPDALAESVLPGLEDEAELRELLAYDEDTAGGLMEGEWVAVQTDWTIDRVTEEVRRLKEIVDPVFTVYVTDTQDRLVGYLPLKTVLLSPAEATAGAVMDEEMFSVTAEMDQEEVANLMIKYDLTVVPVVDVQNRVIGRITVDDIVDVIREEAEEDIQRMHGISGGDEELTATVLDIYKGRVTWLIGGLVGALFASLVIQMYEHALSLAIVLASFIPIVMAMAGNAGIQSAAITVQGLASGEIWASEMLKRLGKEISVALVNGLTIGLIAAMVIGVLGAFGSIPEDEIVGLALTLGSTLFFVILLAASVGTLVPIVLHRLNVDPAVGMGPFVTTSNDILGLLVYFLMAQLFFLN